MNDVAGSLDRVDPADFGLWGCSSALTAGVASSVSSGAGAKISAKRGAESGAWVPAGGFGSPPSAGS